MHAARPRASRVGNSACPSCDGLADTAMPPASSCRYHVAMAPIPSRHPLTPKPVVKPSAKVAPKMVSEGALQKRKKTAAREQNVVTATVALIVGSLALIGGISAASMMQTSNAQTAIVGSFDAVHTQQRDFRVINQRFATWSELSANGMALPEAQSVVTSNADASHWFLSIRDRDAGVVCDGIGALNDDAVGVRPPVCRPTSE